ncbi:N-acetylmannosamine kinase [Clostridia bacterium]|nr:N-acetylmannosamine kinase [Clostridia bacterium]
MGILAFDIGGSAVKYGVWEEDHLVKQNAVALPKDWTSMKETFYKIFEELNENKQISGIALSAPGLVDEATGEIQGDSAVPYIHRFPIQKELEEYFALPVTMENDANCAALAEVWQGAAKDAQHCIFLVIGTGIGGAIVINRELFRGKNLFCGEFGYMFLNDSTCLSISGSMVRALGQYNQTMGKKIKGEELFTLAEQGDLLAEEITTRFFRAIAMGIFNLLVSFDPGLVILGGGVSANQKVLENIKRHVNRILIERNVTTMDYRIEACQFGNDANLIGAVYHHTLKKR